MSTTTPAVYFHVGLGKIASTYLQYRFFPDLTGIHYVQRTRYKNYRQILDKGDFDKYLFSREFDRQFETEVTEFAKHYPDTHIIILLRQHDSWIASQYRRWVKNGYTESFETFIDLEQDQGEWLQKDLYFYPKLKLIENLFTQKPLVLFHDDLKNDPDGFFKRMADYMGATFNKKAVNLKPKHTSYNLKQLRMVKSFNQKFGGGSRARARSDKKILGYLQFRSKWLLLHLIMYLSPLIPDKWVNSKPLYTDDYLKKIRSFYGNDWQQCQDFAANKSA